MFHIELNLLKIFVELYTQFNLIQGENLSPSSAGPNVTSSLINSKFTGVALNSDITWLDVLVCGTSNPGVTFRPGSETKKFNGQHRIRVWSNSFFGAILFSQIAANSGYCSASALVGPLRITIAETSKRWPMPPIPYSRLSSISIVIVPLVGEVDLLVKCQQHVQEFHASRDSRQ